MCIIVFKKSINIKPAKYVSAKCQLYFSYCNFWFCVKKNLNSYSSSLLKLRSLHVIQGYLDYFSRPCW